MSLGVQKYPKLESKVTKSGCTGAPIPIPRTIFIQHFRVEIISFPFVLFHRDRFFDVCCLFRERFSAAYLLKIFLPQRVHTTLFIRYENPALTRWCLCSLHAGIQML